MAVYVDSFLCLSSDTLAELHTFAMQLGLARTSYRHDHHSKQGCYYPLLESERACAIQQGASVKIEKNSTHFSG